VTKRYIHQMTTSWPAIYLCHICSYV